MKSFASSEKTECNRLFQRLEAAIARLVHRERALIFPSTTHVATDLLPLFTGSGGCDFPGCVGVSHQSAWSLSGEAPRFRCRTLEKSEKRSA